MSQLRGLLHQLADAVADRLEQGDARYYDQHSSPLPAATHCKLVRQGTLPGFKRHGRVFIERVVLHRYIESSPVEPVSAAPVKLDPVAAALERAGFREAG